MAKKFNLLPVELNIGDEFKKSIKIIKTATLVLLSFSIFVGVIGIIIFIYYTNQIRSLNQENQSLTTSIQNLENAEQSLVLIKDRLNLLDQILSDRDAEVLLGKQTQIITSLPENISVASLYIDPENSKSSFASSSSIAINNLFTNLSANRELTSLILERLTLNPYLGYNFIFNLE